MTQQLFSRSPQERTKATSAVDRRLIMALMYLWVTAPPPKSLCIVLRPNVFVSSLIRDHTMSESGFRHQKQKEKTQMWSQREDVMHERREARGKPATFPPTN